LKKSSVFLRFLKNFQAGKVEKIGLK